jgi:steroid delta-isomerase-like uncharacterized protein
MTPQEERNWETVLKAIKALSDHDVDGFLAYHTEDATSHEPFYPDPIPVPRLRVLLHEWLHTYPDAKIETQSSFVEGDTVAVENLVSGTFVNDFLGQKATGKPYQVREAVFFELENGKIKRERIYIDQRSIEEQLGTYIGQGAGI